MTASDGPADAPATPGGEAAVVARFAEHLGKAGSLVAGQRYQEAEGEVLRALGRVPGDMRALNLLALVRFKLGRLDEARATYREIAARVPGDASVRRNLGLLALKAERIDEAISELEVAARLGPDDQGSWSYLGFAYTRRGDTVAAAAAFRRGGQDAVADELEASRAPSVVAVPPASPLAPVPEPPLREPAPPAAAAAADADVASAPPISVLSSWSEAAERRSAETRAVPVVSFVLSSLGLGPERGTAAMVKAGAPVRLSGRDGAHVRADAVLASVGASSEERAVRRVRGRPSSEWLGPPMRPFFRLSGPGDVWVAGAYHRWAALTLDDDILYLREDRVLAFDGGVSWEAGRIPGDGLRMLQFRGRGQVVLQLAGMPTAIRVTDDAPARVSRGALLGWVGRIVAYRPRRDGPVPISCEGEGVMLVETRRSAS